MGRSTRLLNQAGSPDRRSLNPWVGSAPGAIFYLRSMLDAGPMFKRETRCARRRLATDVQGLQRPRNEAGALPMPGSVQALERRSIST